MERSGTSQRWVAGEKPPPCRVRLSPAAGRFSGAELVTKRRAGDDQDGAVSSRVSMLRALIVISVVSRSECFFAIIPLHAASLDKRRRIAG
jgi:hypothetical protein